MTYYEITPLGHDNVIIFSCRTHSLATRYLLSFHGPPSPQPFLSPSWNRVDSSSPFSHSPLLTKHLSNPRVHRLYAEVDEHPPSNPRSSSSWRARTCEPPRAAGRAETGSVKRIVRNDGHIPRVAPRAIASSHRDSPSTMIETIIQRCE